MISMKNTIVFVMMYLTTLCGYSQSLHLTAITPVSATTVLHDNEVLDCTHGAGLIRSSAAFTFDMVQVVGNNVLVKGCIIDSQAGTGNGIHCDHCSNLVVEGNEVLNIVIFDKAGGIFLDNAVSPTVRYNHVTGVNTTALIFGLDSTTDVVVTNNRLESSTVPIPGVQQPARHGIAFHNQTPGGTMRGITITDNVIVVNSGFGIEVGDFGANFAVDGVDISNNRVTMAADGYGGYSFLNVTRSTVTNNKYWAEGFNTSIAPIECVRCWKMSITDNFADISLKGFGFVHDRSNLVKWSNNTIVGINANGPAAYGIHFIVNNPDQISMSNNSFTGNTVVFDTGTQGNGVWLQCNITQALCLQNVFINNHIVAPASPNINAVLLQSGPGTVAFNVTTPNTLIH